MARHLRRSPLCAAPLSCLAALLCCGLPFTLSAYGAGRNVSRTTTQVLVDLARDVGATKRGAQTDADALQIRTLLQAAQRLDPSNIEAAYWLFELSVLTQDMSAIRGRLEQLRQLDTGNEAVFSRWLDVGPAGLKRAEDRQRWLAEMLSAPAGLTPAMQAQVNAQLANLMLTRADRDAARKFQAAAVELFPASPAAALLGLSLLPDDAPPQDFVRAALAALAMNPSQMELAWRIGLVLDDVGLPNDASTFYEHALGGPPEAADHRMLNGERWVQLAANSLARGRGPAALQMATNALQDAPTSLGGLLTLDWLLKRMDRETDEKQLAELIRKRFAVVREPNEWPVETVNEAAWLACTLDEQPQRALALAQDVMTREPANPSYKRTLGWALALNKKNNEARAVLEPLVERDAYAAYRVAKMAADDGDSEAAATVLKRLKNPPQFGPVRDLLAELKMPAAAINNESVRAVIEQFDRQIFDYRKAPGKYLEATVTPDDVSPAVGEPWWVTCTLTNRGKAPITLGPSGDTNPQFLISVSLEGEKPSSFAAAISVPVERTQVLMPGKSVAARETIDIGPVRRTTQRFPQTMMRVTLNVLLDPVELSDGQWRAAAGGQSLRPVYFNRLPVATDPDGLQSLTAQCNEDPPVRYRAIETLAQLLAEQQRAAAGKLGYRTQAVALERLRPGLLNGLRSTEWETRARTLDALQAAGLDDEMLAAARESLRHSHWLVRMMAVRLIARQGAAAAGELSPLGESDADELVRTLCRSYIESWRAAESQPTSRPR